MYGVQYIHTYTYNILSVYLRPLFWSAVFAPFCSLADSVGGQARHIEQEKEKSFMCSWPERNVSRKWLEEISLEKLALIFLCGDGADWWWRICAAFYFTWAF